MDRQEQIDKICEWMGWEKRPTEYKGFFNWFHKGSLVPGVTMYFNPFTNPADCAVVMDEVAKRPYGVYTIIRAPRGYVSQVALDQVVHLGESQDSWMEAFCLALLETIKER